MRLNQIDYQICCLLKTGVLEKQKSKQNAAREALALIVEQLATEGMGAIKIYLDDGLRPYLDEALKKTELDIKKNLDRFCIKYKLDLENLDCQNESDSSRLRKSFLRWTSMILKADCIDARRKKKNVTEFSFDAKIGDTEAGKDFYEVIPAPTLSGLDELIKKEKIKIARTIQEYIDKDPEGRLKQSHPRKRPECNCQVLMQMYLLAEPPLEIKKIVKKLKAPSATVYERIKICQKLLQEVVKDIEEQKD